MRLILSSLNKYGILVVSMVFVIVQNQELSHFPHSLRGQLVSSLTSSHELQRYNVDDLIVLNQKRKLLKYENSVNTLHVTLKINSIKIN